MIEHRNEKSELHRVDGPAVVRANGDCEWWVDGELIKSEHGKEKE
jgi:hypothetical protein